MGMTPQTCLLIVTKEKKEIIKKKLYLPDQILYNRSQHQTEYNKKFLI